MTLVRRKVDVYTDGACSSNLPGKPGGWAWATLSGKHQDSGFQANTTNQQMELRAALEAIRARGKFWRICIVSDSAYLINCFEDKWYRGWKNGRKRDGSEVSNWDIWSELIPLVLEHKVTFRKVKGHSGDPGNELVDQLAVEAKKRGEK